MTGSIFRLYLLIHLIEMMAFSGALRYNQKCFLVHGKSVCFFQYVNYTKQPNLFWKSWNQANQICQSENGTLPLLVNDLMQEVFGRYIDSLQVDKYSDMWIAGREININRWKWVNGDGFTLPGYRILGGDNMQHNHVALTDKFEFQGQPASETSNYVCQHFGDPCQVRGSFRLGSGCVLRDSEDSVTFYEARNRCLDRGGDLVVINNSEDLNRIRQVFLTSKGTRKLWIGLRRQWWQWSSNKFNENIDVRYSNWDADYGFKRDLGCMTLYPNTGRWRQYHCESYFRFFCQEDIKVPEAVIDGRNAPRSSFNVLLTSIIAGVSFMAFIIIVVVVVVVVKKRRKVGKSSEKSYQHLFHRNLQENGTDSNQDKYTKLQLAVHSIDQERHNHHPAQLHSPTTSETQSSHYESIRDEEYDYRIGPSYLELQSSL